MHLFNVKCKPLLQPHCELINFNSLLSLNSPCTALPAKRHRLTSSRRVTANRLLTRAILVLRAHSIRSGLEQLSSGF
jgi:hypothetical protein